MISWGISFTLYDYFKKKFKKEKHGEIKASLCTGLINVCITNPLSVISNTMVANSKKNIHLGLFATIDYLAKTGGIKSFYKGFGIALILVLNPIMNFSIHHNMRAFLENKIQSVDLKNMISGMASKLLATLTTYPYTTVKNRQQAQRKPLGIIMTILHIYIQHGFKGFYNGLGSKIIHTLLNNALMFVLFERLRNWIRRVVLKWRKLKAKNN